MSENDVLLKVFKRKPILGDFSVKKKESPAVFGAAFVYSAPVPPPQPHPMCARLSTLGLWLVEDGEAFLFPFGCQHI